MNQKPNKGSLFTMLIIGCSLFWLSSCKNYLDKKPLIDLVIPETLDDLEALLNNAPRMNESNSDLNELLCNNSYVDNETYNSVASYAANEALLYIWKDDGTFDLPWTSFYKGSIYYANTVLDQLPLIQRNKNNEARWDNVKGRALFHRSFTFHCLAQLYCGAFDEAKSNDPGIVLKLSSNINEKIERSTLLDSYGQMISDAKDAASLLPHEVGSPISPNKAAAYGLLARIYLSMRDYPHAKEYASLAIQEKGELLDFNNLVKDGETPIPYFNAEVLFHSTGGGTTLAHPYYAEVDSKLFSLYSEADLRKTIFFHQNENGGYNFQGSYNGTIDRLKYFNGITTAEMYLIYAETLAREGDVKSAIAQLNKFWENRCSKGFFQPLLAENPSDALKLILNERRKEFVNRGLWWSDLRRLNLENENISLTKTVNNMTYSLPPKDPRWTLLIPQSVLELNPSITQNAR